MTAEVFNKLSLHKISIIFFSLGLEQTRLRRAKMAFLIFVMIFSPEAFPYVELID